MRDDEPHWRGSPDCAADPRALQLHRDQPKRDVPFVPTDGPVVAAMLDLAQVTAHDVVYDLGCGDGRIVVEAARRGARGVGVDIDLQRVHEAQDNVRRAGVGRRVAILRQSFFDVDLRDATVVFLYLLPGLNVRLRPKLLWELRPGARVVSNNFDMKEWPPDATVGIHHRTLYKWIVPAWVQGKWECVLNQPQRDGESRQRRQRQRQRLALDLRRHFQRVSGVARVGGHDVAISDGRICGDELSFVLHHAEHFWPPMRFTARVEGSKLRGTCALPADNLAAHRQFAWCGTRA